MKGCIVLETYDKRNYETSWQLAIHSQFIRNLLEEDSTDSPICVLSDKSCTHEVVAFIFEVLCTSTKGVSEGVDSDLKKIVESNQRSSFVVKVLQAACFLDIQLILDFFAKSPGVLHQVAASGCADLVRALVDMKADVAEHIGSSMDMDSECSQELERGRLLAKGWTELMIVASQGLTSRVRAMINTLGADGALLHARLGKVKTAQPQTWGEFHTDTDKMIVKLEGPGKTALHLACENGHFETVDALLDAGAETHTRDCDHNTPLHTAAHAGHASVIVALARRRADVHAHLSYPEDRYTPLHMAASAGQPDAVRALLAAGADPAVRAVTHSCWWCERDVTPLHLAGGPGGAKVAELLLAARAPVHAAKNGCCGDGLTPLHVAARRGAAGVVRELLAARANPLLRADLSQSDDSSFWGCAAVTPLHMAALPYLWVRQGWCPEQVEVVAALVRASGCSTAARLVGRVGTDTTEVVMDGWTPADCAAESGRPLARWARQRRQRTCDDSVGVASDSIEEERMAEAHKHWRQALALLSGVGRWGCCGGAAPQAAAAAADVWVDGDARGQRRGAAAERAARREAAKAAAKAAAAATKCGRQHHRWVAPLRAGWESSKERRRAAREGCRREAQMGWRNGLLDLP